MRKLAVAVGLAAAAMSASAITVNLGHATLNVPLVFANALAEDAFHDVYEFNTATDAGGAFAVKNAVNVVFNSMRLVFDPDGIHNNGDDKLVAAMSTAPTSNMTLLTTGLDAGQYYLHVFGSGPGIYSGAAVITDGNLPAVPEPEPLALMSAGLLALYGLNRKRRN